jgi:hypothetical protein
MRGLAATAVSAALSVACGLDRIHTEPRTEVQQSSTRVLLDGKPFDLHLAKPTTPRANDVLVIYASGDGGWFGAAVHMFEQITRDGYTRPASAPVHYLSRPPIGRACDPGSAGGRLRIDHRPGSKRDGPVAFHANSARRLVAGRRVRGMVASDPREQLQVAGVVAIGLAEERT